MVEGSRRQRDGAPLLSPPGLDESPRFSHACSCGGASIFLRFRAGRSIIQSSSSSERGGGGGVAVAAASTAAQPPRPSLQQRGHNEGCSGDSGERRTPVECLVAGLSEPGSSPRSATQARRRPRYASRSHPPSAALTPPGSLASSPPAPAHTPLPQCSLPPLCLSWFPAQDSKWERALLFPHHSGPARARGAKGAPCPPFALSLLPGSAATHPQKRRANERVEGDGGCSVR